MDEENAGNISSQHALLNGLKKGLMDTEQYDISQATNPIICLLLVLLKILSFCFYFFLNLFLNSRIHTFIILILTESLIF